MGLMKKLLKTTGAVAGGVIKYGVKATGHTIGFIADHADKPNLAKHSREISDGVGDVIQKTTKFTGEILGATIDKAVEAGGTIGGTIGGFIAKQGGADEEKIKTSKIIGSAIGGGAVGLITGELIGSAITGLTVANGVASTGTAISSLNGAAQTTATMAAIGGGAISAGGGGIAAGQAILTGITTATTTATAISASKNEFDKTTLASQNLIEDTENVIYAEYNIKSD